MDEPYSVRVYRLGLSRHLRAEVIRDGMVIAWATISGEGRPSEAVAVARQWAASLGYPTPEPDGRPRSSGAAIDETASSGSAG
ncbi:MAG TPA: hypothetical protein VIU62_11030 [Chloroflexota bacterium]|jgi:hypothetical protein